MADGRGGSRTPESPAPVSGPGSLSKRTDGQKTRDLTGLPYGDAGEFHDIQSSASMAQAAPANPNVSAGPAASAVAPPIGLGAPTQFPDQPVTAGAPFGPGPGTEVLPGDPDKYQELRKQMPVLLKLADLRTTSPQTRLVIRYLRGVL